MFKNPIIKSDISQFFISLEGSGKREQMGATSVGSRRRCRWTPHQGLWKEVGGLVTRLASTGGEVSVKQAVDCFFLFSVLSESRQGKRCFIAFHLQLPAAWCILNGPQKKIVIKLNVFVYLKILSLFK